MSPVPGPPALLLIAHHVDDTAAAEHPGACVPASGRLRPSVRPWAPSCCCHGRRAPPDRRPRISPDIATARRNAVLDGLADHDLAYLLDDLRPHPLTLGDVLHEPGAPIHTVHFPLTGVVSVVADLGPGQVVETATIGREGIVGLAVFLGAGVPTERSLVQVAGTALSMSVEGFRAAIADVDGPLTTMLRRSAQAQFTQVSRNAACNRVHTVAQRAARWLLATADRMDSPTFDLTQHFLAQMLAVRRTSISDVAQALADDGAISYTRGTITITDRARLHTHACNCYADIRDATTRALTTT